MWSRPRRVRDSAVPSRTSGPQPLSVSVRINRRTHSGGRKGSERERGEGEGFGKEQTSHICNTVQASSACIKRYNGFVFVSIAHRCLTIYSTAILIQYNENLRYSTTFLNTIGTILNPICQLWFPLWFHF